MQSDDALSNSTILWIGLGSKFFTAICSDGRSLTARFNYYNVALQPQQS